MTTRNKNLAAALLYTAAELLMIDSSDDESEEKIFDNLEENAAVFAGLRYSENVPKNLSWYENVLPNLDDKRFRMLLRCNKVQFNVVLGLIENHPAFHGKNSDKQFTVHFQLAVVLYRLGSYGEDATIGKIASFFGVGGGGTIAKVTSRVFESILALETEFLYWPSSEERNELVRESFDYLPHCIGYVDVTEIPLQERPVWTFDPESFLSKDKRYAIKLQAVGDYTLRFRQILVGHPGSVDDARIYNDCMLGTRPNDFFTEPQYLLGDCAYKLTCTVLTPFRDNSTALTQRKRLSFNRAVNSKRVRIEQSFGVMKERFPSLKCLPVKIKDESSNKLAVNWIRVCCILHNILIPHYDEEDVSGVEKTNMNRVEEEEKQVGVNDDGNSDGNVKRIALYEIIADRVS